HYDEFGEFLGRSITTRRAQGEITLLGLKPTGTQLDILSPHGGFDIDDGQPTGRQRAPVEPNTQRGLAKTHDVRERDTFGRRDAVLDVAIDIVGNFKLRAVRR